MPRLVSFQFSEEHPQHFHKAVAESERHQDDEERNKLCLLHNRPVWTGTSLLWRLKQGNIIKKRLMSFVLSRLPAYASIPS